MKGIEQTSAEAYAHKLIVMTSTITLTEFEQAVLTSEQRVKFQQLFIHPNWRLVDVDKRVASKAAVIRRYYDTRVFDASGKLLSGGFMSLGDSLHLATALQYEVAEFNTLDGSGKRPKKIDLLKLNGQVADASLRITVPKYVPPSEPLSGPVPQIEGQQRTLELVEENQKQTDAPLVGSHSQQRNNGTKEEITEGQPQTSAALAADGGSDAPPSPSPGSAVAEPDQSALGGEKQKLGQQASPPSDIGLASPKAEPPASDKPAGGSGGS
jgi:PIN domain